MSLRPRYSLLALLILTAAIAGGMQLWRGPHRVSFLELSTNGEISKNFPSATRVPWGPFKLECEYLRDFGEIQYVALIGRPNEPSTVYLQREFETAPGKAFLYRVDPKAEPPTNADERVICWFFENERYVTKPDISKDQWRAYLLTNQRKIYTCVPWMEQSLVSEVELQQIEDPALRDCMQRECDKLP